MLGNKMSSLITADSIVKVSSVLNRDVKQFGKKYLFDGDDETCWNSDQGSPQWVEVNFQRTVSVEEIHIMFQGGFTGRECSVEVLYKDQTEYKKAIDFFPEDVNSMQVFTCPANTKEVTSIRVIFSNSTDFFGRITIYQMDITGS